MRFKIVAVMGYYAGTGTIEMFVCQYVYGKYWYVHNVDSYVYMLKLTYTSIFTKFSYL